MSVRLKVRCTRKGETVGWGMSSRTLIDLELRPVTDTKVYVPGQDQPMVAPSEENKAFFAATPSGEIKFQTVNEEAALEIQVGREYYVTIEAAPAEPSATDAGV